MKLGLFTFVAMYFTLWWIVLFAILPLGAKSHAEAGIEVSPGGDPGSPVAPNLVRKAITTTWVTAIVFAVLVIIIQTGVVPIPQMASDH